KQLKLGYLNQNIYLEIANKRLREKLHEQSIHDTLKGIYNLKNMEELWFIINQLKRQEKQFLHLKKMA
ncbi:MAG: hypothetical protein QXT71_03785, partial [Thermoplasmata archaeon]